MKQTVFIHVWKTVALLLHIEECLSGAAWVGAAISLAFMF
jgi:hypothetical protein